MNTGMSAVNQLRLDAATLVAERRYTEARDVYLVAADGAEAMGDPDARAEDDRRRVGPEGSRSVRPRRRRPADPSDRSPERGPAVPCGRDDGVRAARALERLRPRRQPRSRAYREGARVITDEGAWRAASDADAFAYRLQERAHRTRGRGFAPSAIAAAQAFEVAGDAWEVVDDLPKADIRRNLARYWYVEAFTATHRYLMHGHYLVSDREAWRVARAADLRPPSAGRFLSLPLTGVGPQVELHHMRLIGDERERFNRKRAWVYAIARLR